MVDEIVAAVRGALEANPTQRLGQLLENASAFQGRDLFLVTDEDMIEILGKYRRG